MDCTTQRAGEVSGNQQASESSAMDVDKTGAPEAQQAVGTLESFEEQLRRFNALPEEEQQVYAAFAEEDQQRYAAELEAYQRENVEEVLLGSEKGLVLRVPVGTVPITNRKNRGRVLCKLKPGDRLCATSLLSSMDDDPDEGAGAARALPARPAQSRPAVRRGGRPKKAAISGGLQRRLSLGAARAGADGNSSALAASTPRGKWRLSGKTRKSLAASPAGGLGGKLRLRGKTRVSQVLCPWLGKRGRLSLLASSAAASRSSVGPLSVLKPELRFLRPERRNADRRLLNLSALRCESASSSSAGAMPLLPMMDGAR